MRRNPLSRLRFKVTAKDLFFNDREKRLFLLSLKIGGALLACALLLVIVILFLTAVSRPEKTATSHDVEEHLELTRLRLDLSQFRQSDKIEELLKPIWRSWRPRLSRWTEEMVDRFWIPPQEIELEKLKQINDNNIERLLQELK